MNAYEVKSLDIHGFGWIKVPNRFFVQQEKPAQTLALMLPGLRYSCDMPLLYYMTRLLQSCGADVMQVQADYTAPGFQNLSRGEQFARLAGDARGALMGARSGRFYTRLVIIGKSIGTLAMTQLMTETLCSDAISIWLTPLLRQSVLVEAACAIKAPALFAAGTADPIADAAALERIQQAAGADILLLPDADHSLEVAWDAVRSAQYLLQVMQASAALLERSGLHPAAAE